MLNVDYYFKTDTFLYSEIFHDCEFVWDALKKLKGYIDDNLVPEIRGEVMEGAFVSSKVYVAEGAVIEPFAMIKGPAIIGPGAFIAQGAYIREYCIIGQSAVVGHDTELKGAIMLNNAKAPHFSYVGDSILGNDVNLGAGTKISNLKNNGSNIIVSIEGHNYDTGLSKFGTIIGDRVNIGCNTVTNPGTLIGPGTHVYPNALLRGIYPAEHIVKVRQNHEIVEKK